MAPPTRLDPVVRLESHREEAQLQRFADAGRRAAAERARLVDLRARANTDGRRPGKASEWVLADNAHAQALVAIKLAERSVEEARRIEHDRRLDYLQAKARTDAMRRAAESRRQAWRFEAEKAESRSADELTLLRFTHKHRAV